MFSFRPTLFLAMVAISGNAAVNPRDLVPGSEEFVDYINSVQKSWVAEKTDLPLDWDNLFGVLPETFLPENQLPKMVMPCCTKDKLPESFDARTRWSNCSSIREIRDQSNCGSCWAVSSESVMSDRICIASGGKSQTRISGQDLLSCAESPSDDGCGGGSPLTAFRHWVDTGVVTGGPYGSKLGCRPYQYPPCEHHIKGPLSPCDSLEKYHSKCTKKCRENYEHSYDDDLSFGETAYRVSGEEDIMREIYQNGPVVASFLVYSDFTFYKSGVYKHAVDDVVSGHAVRVIGWGVDKASKLKYWLVTNSWNSHWGENGTMRYIRGENEGGFEASVTAGAPRL